MTDSAAATFDIRDVDRLVRALDANTAALHTRTGAPERHRVLTVLFWMVVAAALITLMLDDKKTKESP